MLESEVKCSINNNPEVNEMKQVIVIDMLNPQRTKLFASVADAATQLGLDASTVSRAASGDRGCKSASGKVIVFA